MIRRWAWILLAVGFAAALAFTRAERSRAYDPWLDRFPVEVAKIDLNDERLEFVPALPDGQNESFESMLKRLKPLAAINGTFYDSSYRVLGDVVIDGKVVRRGGQRHAIGITPGGEIRFLHRGNGHFNWSGISSGLASGPLLVRSGKMALDPEADGFKPASKTLRARRSAVGTTKDGNILFVSVPQPVTLLELANIMLALGASEAINLDGGGATALYYDGKIAVAPSVPMTNILIVRGR